MAKRKTLKSQSRNSGFGLKEISNRVREIIKRVGTTSYKEISDEIVSEINEKNIKDEKNIRRRIYDSLNVMKSMKLFKKDKETKKIVWNFPREKSSSTNDFVLNADNNSSTQNDNCNNCNINTNEDDKSIEQILTLKQEINDKKNKLNLLQKQIECLNKIIERNKQVAFVDNKKIFFPFIIIEFSEKISSNDPKIKVAMNETKTQAHFAFDSANKLYGDLDAVIKIGNNIVNTFPK
jgi:hypothetical protein